MVSLKKKSQTTLTILLILTLFLITYIQIAKAEDLIVYGSNFQIISETNGKFAFQHPSIEYETLGDTITLTVTNGTLNGTSATLTMYSTNGILTFISQNTTTITLSALSEATLFHINGVVTNTTILTSGNNYKIEWSILEPELWLPLMFILGMFGLASMFAGPLYAVHLGKKGEYRDAFVNGILITAVGFALIVAWLWA